jgi:hypothetical protein
MGSCIRCAYLGCTNHSLNMVTKLCEDHLRVRRLNLQTINVLIIDSFFSTHGVNRFRGILINLIKHIQDIKNKKL